MNKYWQILKSSSHLLLYPCAFCLGLFFGMDKSTKDILQFIDVLRQTAILIFGVVGAWIAVLFPMLHSTPGLNSDKDGAVKKLMGKLFKPMTYSLYVVVLTLIMPILISVAQKILIPRCVIPYLRGASFGVICVLTALQLYTIFLALDPFDFVKTKNSLEKEKKECQDRFKNR